MEEANAIVIDQEEVDYETAIDAFEMFEQAVSKIATIEDAKTFLANLDKLEKLLKAADMWHEKACDYMVMEAEAYIRIAELGLADAIPHQSKKYKVVKWLEEMHPSERKAYAEECYDGISIVKIYEKVVEVPLKQVDDYSRLHSYRDNVIREYERDGVVSLSEYDNQLEFAKRTIPADVVNGFKDDVRNKLRQRGAHGVGDDNGTYVSTNRAISYIEEVVGNKVWSITKDIGRLKRIVAEEEPEYGMDFYIGTDTNFTLELSTESAIGVMFVLCGLGEPHFGDRSELSKAKLMANMLEKFGYTPCGLVSELYKRSIQAVDETGLHPSLAQIDMRDYGWPDKKEGVVDGD